MAENKYTKLDSLIAAALRSRPSTFTQLLSGAVRDECIRLNNEHTGAEWRRPGAYRFLDRRLQALRKTGVIRFDTLHGWEYIERDAR